VYLHKTTVAAERMLVSLKRRAQTLKRAGENVPASEALSVFMNQSVTLEAMQHDRQILRAFGSMDDHDIWGAIKLWRNHDDKILSLLSSMLIARRLFQIILSTDPIKRSIIEQVRTAVATQFHTLRVDSSYLYSLGAVTNEAYTEGEKINILTRSGELLDIAQASDL